MLARALLSLGASLWLATALAKAPDNGTAALVELELPVSALAAAAGGASAGLVNDASAVADNPARLGTLPGAVAATYVNWPSGLNASDLAGTYRFAGYGTAGVLARVLRAGVSGAAENFDGSYGGAVAAPAYQTVEVVGALSPDLSFVRDWTSLPVSAGVSGAYLQRALGGVARSGLAAGAGLHVQWSEAVGTYAVGRRLGRLGGEPLPAAAAAGVTGTARGLLVVLDRVRGAVEASWGREGGAGGAAAAEYALIGERMELDLRVGYSAGAWGRPARVPTGGAALRWGSLSLEGALAPAGDLGWAPVISLSYQPGEEEQPER